MKRNKPYTYISDEVQKNYTKTYRQLRQEKRVEKISEFLYEYVFKILIVLAVLSVLVLVIHNLQINKAQKENKVSFLTSYYKNTVAPLPLTVAQKVDLIEIMQNKI